MGRRRSEREDAAQAFRAGRRAVLDHPDGVVWKLVCAVGSTGAWAKKLQ
jgi:hypothetical protein